jgi:hypothetical protein
MARSKGARPTSSYPQGYAQPGYPSVAQAEAVKTSASRDADGIPDEVDVAPAAPASPPMAALAPPPPPMPQQPPGGGPPRPGPTLSDGVQTPQLLVYTAQLTLAVYRVPEGLAEVEAIGKSLGGYLASRQDNAITIRVPRDRFEEAVGRVAKSGDVVHREVNALDVTDEYVDLEIRLKNARAMRDRLATLLEKAPVKEALEIEKELGRVTAEIESMEGKLKLLRDRVAFSTITVTFAPRGPSGVHDTKLNLPYPWLDDLALPSLLDLRSGS